MLQIAKISKELKRDTEDSFRLFPAIITLILMTLFMVSTIYVLISSLL